MVNQKSMGFIDFNDIDQDQDIWRAHLEKDGKLYIPQGQSCHETHPDLSIGGGTLVGGNCSKHKRHKDVDLYVALDWGQQAPEYESGVIPARCVYYPIRNMGIPQRPDKFHALIKLICEVLASAGKVHVGCIGGHGRTGMVLAAVAARTKIAGPENDAIGWVRSHYCQKAIETKAQEGFIVVAFGAKPQAGTQTPYQTKRGFKPVDKPKRGR